MYQEKLVCAIKHNGRVLREQGDTVLIPFGSEYSLFFKNLNSVRALVRVEVDGLDATKGTSLIVPANGSIDLERFLEAGQMDKGHKFKFIERTQKIEDGPRGIKAEDGLIRIEFEFEQQPAKVEYETIKRTYVDDYWRRYPRNPLFPYEVLCSTTTFGSTSGEVKTSALRSVKGLAANASAQNASVQNASAPLNDVGITVPGAISEQKFEVGTWFPTDGQKHVMVLRLLGQVGEKKVEKPVTVKTKTECPTCGTKNKFGTKFCRECGRSLTLL